jgi:putative oxidoreductase
MNNARFLPFAGRLLIGLPFILFGLGKATSYTATVATIKAVGLPLPPLAFLGAVAIEAIGGALLVAGYKVRPVAAAMAVFSITTAIFFHSNLADQNNFVHFFKNIMMTGGLLQIVALGAGAFSLDNRSTSRRIATGGLATAS